MNVLDIDRDYNMLSLRELIEARDHYHLHLIERQHVIGTAVGRYLIRRNEDWPSRGRTLRDIEAAERAKDGREPRTLDTSDVRPYSWPCVIVFVNESVKHCDLDPAEAVPPALLMPDGSRVPVCVVYAPTEPRMPLTSFAKTSSDHAVGGGSSVLINSQGSQYFGSVGCIVTDGHTHFALTSRHVAGPKGTQVLATVRGTEQTVGQSVGLDLTHRPFRKVYPHWPSSDVFVNLDVGLIEIKNINDWTPVVHDIGVMGELADVSCDNLSLRLIDCDVIARGGASGLLKGKIKALFYRYKRVGGFEYVADCLIAPTGTTQTVPGDSGTVWMLHADDERRSTFGGPRPLAIEWGAQRFLTDGAHRVSPFTLATFLSTVCRELRVDVVRDWNLGSLNYWGAVGHYLIAERAIDFLSKGTLRDLLKANLENITFRTEDITKKTTDGLSSHPFVQLADVPDLVWKHAKKENGGRQGHENPNHFANMDLPDRNHETLLDICADPANINVARWQKYYDEVKGNRGSLPFRIWQFFDAMLAYLTEKDYAGFICAAGTMAHYVGDACQPLHISHLFDGDPTRPVDDPKTPGKKQKYGAGVHEAYERDMVNYHVGEIVEGINSRRRTATDGIVDGAGSARATVELMRRTFGLAQLKPMDIVETFHSLQRKGDSTEQIADGLWSEFGEATKDTFANGCECLAHIWLSAWNLAGGDGHHAKALEHEITKDTLRDKYYSRQDFVQSYTLDEIGDQLSEAKPSHIGWSPTRGE